MSGTWDEEFAAVARFLGKKIGRSPDSFTPETDLLYDLGIDGDDYEEIIIEFTQQHSIISKEYKWQFHHGPEGCNPIWLLFPPEILKRTRIPIRIKDFLEAKKRKTWEFLYLDPSKNENEESRTSGSSGN